MPEPVTPETLRKLTALRGERARWAAGPGSEILGGRRVGIRIEAATLMFYDLETRELLRTRPNPLSAEQVRRLRGLQPLGHHRGRPSNRSGCIAEPATPA